MYFDVFIFEILFHVDISMNIGHDDGMEFLEEETLDKHNEPQVRSFKIHRSKVDAYFYLGHGIPISLNYLL